MPKIAIILSITTQPGRRTELRAMWDEWLRPRLEANPAQETYLMIEDENDQDVLHLIEVYTSAEEMRRNAEAPWFADYMSKTGPLLAGPPQMRTGQPVWGKGIPV